MKRLIAAAKSKGLLPLPFTIPIPCSPTHWLVPLFPMFLCFPLKFPIIMKLVLLFL